MLVNSKKCLEIPKNGRKLRKMLKNSEKYKENKKNQEKSPKNSCISSFQGFKLHTLENQTKNDPYSNRAIYQGKMATFLSRNTLVGKPQTIKYAKI